MKLSGIFLLFIFVQKLIFGQITFAEKLDIPFSELQKIISCSTVHEKTLEIIYKNKSYQIVFDSLYSTPVVNAPLVCNRFLASLREVTSPSPIIPITKKNIRLGLDIYVDQSGFLERVCLELGYCKRGILDTFKTKKTLRDCQGKATFAGLLAKSLPNIPKDKTNIIKDVSVKIHPLYPFVNILNDYIRDPKLLEIHGSTMTLGNKALLDITKNAVLNNKKVVLNYDAGISLFNYQELQITEALNQLPKIYFFPMTSGNNFDYFYHIKFIASPNSKESVLASMNLSSADRTPYLDLNFFFKDPTIRDEFLSISARNNQRFCDHSDDYDCLAKFYNQTQSSHSSLVINRSCPSINPGAKAKKSGYFANSEDYNLRQFVLNFINQAENEVIVTSYKLTDKKIADSLITKQKEGLRVHAMLAFKSPVLNELKDHFYSGDMKNDQYPFPHMKIIIIDRKLMLFGTANFTVNALDNTTELIGITDNQDAIKTALDTVAVFAQSRDLPLSKQLSSKPKKHNYVAIANASELFSEYLPHTKIIDKPWMLNYREVTPKGKEMLKKCDLEHLIFITKQTYLNCFKKELGEN